MLLHSALTNVNKRLFINTAFVTVMDNPLCFLPHVPILSYVPVLVMSLLVNPHLSVPHQLLCVCVCARVYVFSSITLVE